MTIWTIVNPVALVSGLERSSGAVAAQAVPVFELGMAAVAIAVWALAVAVIAAWLRARERSAARAHIRSIVIARRDIALSSVMKQRQTQSRTAPRQPLATPARQI